MLFYIEKESAIHLYVIINNVEKEGEYKHRWSCGPDEECDQIDRENIAQWTLLKCR